ncbi:MAG TPA: methyltransferase domain-containing protein [bacterium]|nr:methyltransferase domain-containing protein [bacterium]HOL47155.1 methyltransferase domain-containing protein [bacterium]HPQ18078.1 methyltransferase domain-containing protein [bacterium]
MKKNFYKWNPELYQNNSAAQYNWANAILNTYNFKGNETVLDIGCGDGKITYLISQKLFNGEIIGIDLSKEMVEFAQKKYSNQKNLKFKKLNVLRMRYKNKFDLIFSNACIHWIKNHSLLLKKIKDALKNNGKILLSFGGRGNAEQVIKIINKIIKIKKWKSYFTNFKFPWFFPSDNYWQTILLKNNFKINRIELVPKLMSFNNENEFIGWLKTTWMPYIERIPEKLQNFFISEITNKFLKENIGLDIKMMRLEIYAEKITGG